LYLLRLQFSSSSTFVLQFPISYFPFAAIHSYIPV
jgi:hypothetical protein